MHPGELTCVSDHLCAFGVGMVGVVYVPFAVRSTASGVLTFPASIVSHYSDPSEPGFLNGQDVIIGIRVEEGMHRHVHATHICR